MDRIKRMLVMDPRTLDRLTTLKDKLLSLIEQEMSSILSNDIRPGDGIAELYSLTQFRLLELEHPHVREDPQTKKTVNSPDIALASILPYLKLKSHAYSEPT